MTIKQLVVLAIQISMGLIVFCIALYASPRDVTQLLRKPGLLFRSLLGMNLIMPLFAVVLTLVLRLERPMAFALLALSVSPVPPLLPRKQLKAGGTASYVVGLFAISALIAILFVPVAIDLLGLAFARPIHMPIGEVAKIVATGVLGPLAAGIILRLLAPSAAERIARPLSMLANVLLVAAFLQVLVVSRHELLDQIGDFALVAISGFVLAGLGVGHLLGGPDPDDRTVLALATATRHPGVAIAIAHFNAPDKNAVIAAVLLCVLAGAIVSMPYLSWRKHSHTAAATLERRG